MKNATEVLSKLASLVQSHIATASGPERFVDATASAAGLLVTAQDENGVRTQYRVSVERIDEPQLPTAAATEETATPCQSAEPVQDEQPAEADPPTGKDSQPCEGTEEPETPATGAE